MVHSGHLGFLAKQTRRPWYCIRWQKRTRCFSGTIAIRSASILSGSVLLGEAKPLRQAHDMGVDADGLLAKTVAEDDISGFTADAGETDEIC